MDEDLTDDGDDYSTPPPTGEDIYWLWEMFENHAMQVGPFSDPEIRDAREDQYQRLRSWLLRQMSERGTGDFICGTFLLMQDEKRRRRWAGEEDA